jgi:hypothetical protein
MSRRLDWGQRSRPGPSRAGVITFTDGREGEAEAWRRPVSRGTVSFVLVYGCRPGAHFSDHRWGLEAGQLITNFKSSPLEALDLHIGGDGTI